MRWTMVKFALGGALFTHLHVHTEYSMLDGLSRIKPLVLRAQELGMDSLAITDHGGMYGVVDFYRVARDAGVKPILGCEMYVAAAGRKDRGPQEKSPHHLTVLAKNAKGYGNLLKLVTKAHLEGFYYRPRVDRELLQEHHDGLIVLSGCPSGEVPGLLAQERTAEARAAAAWYKELFDDYYLEVMGHDDVAERPVINRGLTELGRELDIPVVATNDSHYVHKGEDPLQDIMVCIQTNTNVKDDSRLKMSADSYYLKSPQEMAAVFPELPDALSNTQRVAEKCELELDFSQLRLPRFEVPNGIAADEYLAQLCSEGLRRRIENVTSEEEQRLAYELEVIRQTRYPDYFLVVWDIARFARENDIFIAVRGSAAASLTLYCLGVTDVNPLPYRMVFERFLNVERKEMPDIDMDFQDDRREEVINYVVSKYGREHVAQIITFGTLGARASIRDVGRALAMPYGDVDRVARLVPVRPHITLDEAMEQSSEMNEMYGADEGIKNLVDTARKLEGLTRHASTHAAGIVISQEPLDEVVPLQKPVKGGDESVTMTQYAMEPIAALGLLKMDLLGLANLTILAKARDAIAGTRGVQVNLREIPLDDPKTFELLSRGETAGVFQLEGSGMTRYIKELKPSSLGDVAAMIALYRPGPMEHITTFIEAKHGRTAPQYPHPALAEILQETYGVIVYQDQVLHIVRTFAGYSLGEADIVRKAMGKKIPEIMAREREKFMEGALGQGYSQELAQDVFALIEPFAGYAFNKAHSVSYGLISYWTAYLKANYQSEYMSALLNSHMGNADKVAAAVAECRRLRIPVLRPDVTRSEAEFSIESTDKGEQAIRFGLAAVKNVGVSAIGPVLEAREKGTAFSSIEHLCREVDLRGLNRKTLESLIKSGAFDAFGDRGALLAVIDRITALAQSEATLRDSGQTTMFDLFGETVPTPLASIPVPEIETPEKERQEWERDLLGVVLSNSSLISALLRDADSQAIVFRSQVEPEMAGNKVAVIGQVSGVTHRMSRNDKPFAIATLGLMDGPIDVFVWEDRLDETRDLWQEGKVVMVMGSVRVREDQISISCSRASEYEVAEVSDSRDNLPVPPSVAEPAVVGQGDDVDGVAQNEALLPATPDVSDAPDEVMLREQAGAELVASRRLSLRIRETGEPMEDRSLLDDMKKLLMEYQGDDEVSLEIATEGRVVTMEWPLVRVRACSELEQQLEGLLDGAGTVTVESVGS